MKTFKHSLVVLALLSTGIVGCATLQNIFGNTAVQAGIQVAIDVGVGLVLQANPSEAGALETAATALQTFAKGSTTTIATFEADADAKIASLTSLNAPEKLALDEIVTLAATALSAGQSALSPTASVDLSIVFGDVANAAAAYTMAAPKAQKMGLAKH
jgi:hypothetical protein